MAAKIGDSLITLSDCDGASFKVLLFYLKPVVIEVTCFSQVNILKILDGSKPMDNSVLCDK